MGVFPAWAGVILDQIDYTRPVKRVPRMGGGDPPMASAAWLAEKCSPHGRG